MCLKLLTSAINVLELKRAPHLREDRYVIESRLRDSWSLFFDAESNAHVYLFIQQYTLSRSLVLLRNRLVRVVPLSRPRENFGDPRQLFTRRNLIIELQTITLRVILAVTRPHGT